MMRRFCAGMAFSMPRYVTENALKRVGKGLKTMDIALIVIFAIVGIVVGFAIAWAMLKSKSNKAASNAEEIIRKAEHDAETIRKEAEVEAKDEAYKRKSELDREINERKREITQQENRIMQREDSLDKRADNLDKREHQMSSMQGQLDRRQNELVKAEDEMNRRLESVAGMTPEQAKEELLRGLKDEVTHESAAIIRDAE